MEYCVYVQLSLLIGFTYSTSITEQTYPIKGELYFRVYTIKVRLELTQKRLILSILESCWMKSELFIKFIS